MNFISLASQLKSKGVYKHFCRDKYLLRNIIWASYSYNDLPECNCLNSQNMILNENNTYENISLLGFLNCLDFYFNIN